MHFKKKLTVSLCSQVFGDMSSKRLQTGVILAPTNKVVRELNTRIQNKLPGEEKVYYSSTSVFLQDSERGDADFIITQEELNSVYASNLPPHELKLKEGSIVMLLLNMNKRQGLCNGTRFVVKHLYQHTICLKRLVPFNGEREEIFIPRMRLRSDDIPVAGTIQRYQFPICLAFAITVNKSQGQSIDYVGLYLRKPVFCHGQFYVAVSRGKRGDRVCVAVVKGPNQGQENQRNTKVMSGKTFSLNIVIKSLLQ